MTVQSHIVESQTLGERTQTQNKELTIFCVFIWVPGYIGTFSLSCTFMNGIPF